MFRQIFLWLFVIALAGTALKHWYYALLMLLLLTVFTQHPDTPASMFGVPGLNAWNICFIVILICWLHGRRTEPPRSRTSPMQYFLLYAYVGLLVYSGIMGLARAGYIRPEYSERFSAMGVLTDGLINPLKYLIVGVFFYDGTRTVWRAKCALLTAVGTSMVYGLLMFKSIGLRIFVIDFQDARRLTDKLIGLFANDLAQLLAFTIWAALLCMVLIPKLWVRLVWFAIIVLNVISFVVLKSRSGYLACCTTGLTLGAIRWRGILLLFPALAAVLWVTVPGLRERVLSGFEERDAANWDEISAGRVTNLWPHVVDQIKESPYYGHGRYAIIHEGCFEKILASEGTVPSHPHCAYLEALLDTGVLGLIVYLSCMFGLIWKSIRLIRMRENQLLTVLGAVSLAASITTLSADITGGSIYPDQSTVPYLAVWGAMLAVSAEITAARAAAAVAPAVVVSPRRPVLRRLEPTRI